MPELPEVETIRRQLEKLIVGKAVSSIEVLNPASFRADQDSLIGKTVVGVGRKGKILITGMTKKKGLQYLYIHLKMSGRLEYKEEGKGKKEEGKQDKHLRVRIKFLDQSELLFSDQRKFGWISDDPAILPAGIDALDPSLSSNKLAKVIGSSSRPIKQILLDQSKIAGIGNIYASEILWQAKTNPFQKGYSLLKQGVSLIEITKAIKKVLLEAIRLGGSTMADGLYRHVGGQAGNYWSRRRVYDRAGQPCRRPACKKIGAVIQKTLIGQRATYFCPSCQSN